MWAMEVGLHNFQIKRGASYLGVSPVVEPAGAPQLSPTQQSSLNGVKSFCGEGSLLLILAYYTGACVSLSESYSGFNDMVLHGSVDVLKWKEKFRSV